MTLSGTRLQFKLRIFVLSALLAVPCFWHRRIEAGDLASHVYNAWLGQLIEKGQAPGLYLVSRWDNVKNVGYALGINQQGHQTS